MKLELSVSENIEFDYSYSQWLSGNKNRKYIRYNLVQVLFNYLLGKVSYVTNYNNRFRATPVVITLIQDEKGNYFRFPAISFFQEAISKFIGKEKTKTLKSFGKKNEVIRRSANGIKSQIEKRNLDEKDIEFLNIFDIEAIEKSRNIGEKEWKIYAKKSEEETTEEITEKSSDFEV